MKHPLDTPSVTGTFKASHLVAADELSRHQRNQHLKIARIVRAHRASLLHKVDENYEPRLIERPEWSRHPSEWQNWYTVTITQLDPQSA